MTITYQRHSLLTSTDVGSIVRWTAVDSTARLALSLTEDDNGRVCHQTDTDVLYFLADYSVPTWVQMSSGSAAVSSVFGRTGDVTAQTGDYTAANVGLGNVQNILSKFDATVSPAVTDDSDSGYAVGSVWVDATGKTAWVCVDATVGAADWNQIDAAGGGGGGTVDVVSNVATSTILGRVTAGSGDSEELTTSQVRTLLNVANGATAAGATGDAHAGVTTGNPHNVSATDVGLGNADNTSDANKPVSTATQTALDNKASKLSGAGAPGASTGNGYAVGAVYADTTGDRAYFLVDATPDANVWATDYPSADASKLSGIEAGADVTDTTNVTAAGALMDSEVDANLKTFALPASTTISAFGATLVDDADAATARATLDTARAPLSGAGAPGVATGNGYPLGTTYADTTNDYGYILVDNTTGANVWDRATGGSPLSGAGAPGVATGNGYPVGTVYADTTADEAYVLTDNTTGSNVWSSRTTKRTVWLTFGSRFTTSVDNTWYTLSDNLVFGDPAGTARGTGSTPSFSGREQHQVVPYDCTVKRISMVWATAATAMTGTLGVFKVTPSLGSVGSGISGVLLGSLVDCSTGTANASNSDVQDISASVTALDSLVFACRSLTNGTTVTAKCVLEVEYTV